MFVHATNEFKRLKLRGAQIGFMHAMRNARRAA
jgi:hypothetical protein